MFKIMLKRNVQKAVQTFVQQNLFRKCSKQWSKKCSNKSPYNITQRGKVRISKNQVLLRLHVGKWYTFFELKSMWRFVILPTQSFFGTSKFHEKSWILCIKISIVQKKFMNKTTFPKSPICDPTLMLWFFEKNRFFFEIFCSNLYF